MQYHASAADRAFVDEDYAAAIQHYTKALEPGARLASGDSASRVYEARAFAHFKLQQWMEAVQDASKAIELDPDNAKAYLRKGMACYKLEEYETALDAFQQGHELAGAKNPQYGIWAQKCTIALAGDSYVTTPTEVMPTVHLPPTPPAKPKAAEAQQDSAKSAAAQPQPPAPPKAAQDPAAAAAAAESHISDHGFSKALTPAAVEEFTGKFRHQWYQLGNKVVVDVYAKNQPKDAVTVQLTGSSNDKLRICIAAQPSGSSGQQQQPPAAAAAAGGEEEGEDYVLELDLFDAVLAEAPLKFEVLRTKVEVTLVKSKPNIHWHTLEKGKGPAAAGVAVPAAAPAAAAGVATPQQQQQAPANVLQYPSSKGPKDWSKVEAEVKELEEKGELEDGDPLNNFFKKIFAQGDEDTRRAMMKSFVESNGTVLSTNWKEVGDKPVEFKAPEGADVKKWDA